MKKFIFTAFLATIFSLTFSNCSSSSDNQPLDLCANTICQNGGVCNNGICNCPDGYMGAYCETERVPLKVSISKVVIKQFPNVVNDPDIYIKIYRQSGNDFIEVYSSNSYYENASPNGTYTFNITPTEDILFTTTPHVIAVFDYNTVFEDEYIGSSVFDPYTLNGGFPVIKHVTLGDINADLTVSYQW